MELREKKEVTNDNKVQVAEILFNDSQLREYIPDKLGKTRGGKVKADIDASASQKLAGFQVLFTKIIDNKVLITLPEK